MDNKIEWKSNINIKDGFDVVIGNPPYIGEKGNKELFHAIKGTNFGKIFYERRMDYFYFFISRGVNLLKLNGLLSFITTNYWVTASGAQTLRTFLKEEINIIKYLDFGEVKVFDSAQGQHNSIFLFEKNKLNKNLRAKITQLSNNNFTLNDNLSEIFDFSKKSPKVNKFLSTTQDDIYSSITNNINFSDFDSNIILKKIKKKSTTILGNICYVSGGVSSSADRVRDSNIKHCTPDEIISNKIEIGNGIFILTQHEIDTLCLAQHDKFFIKPYFKSSEINKWITNENPNKYLIYATHSNASEIEKKDKLYNHFKKFKKILENRSQDIELEMAMKKGHWFVLTNGRPRIDFNIEKIVCPYRSKEVFFAYNNLPWFSGRDVYFMVNFKVPSKYILSILNSKIISFWLKNKGKMKGDIFEMYPEPLKEIPIKEISLEHQQPFISLVDQILEKKKLGEDTKDIEDQIDQMVYDLYDLTPEEIDIVEKNINNNE